LAVCAALARVADAGTRCARPAADPICCPGPLAYPYIVTDGREPPPADGTAAANWLVVTARHRTPTTTTIIRIRDHPNASLRPPLRRDDQYDMINSQTANAHG
jgi:hypothetical protein